MTSRSSGCNRNGFFGFGASLGGLSVVAVLALAPMATPAYADCFGDLTGPATIPDGTVGIEDLQAVTSSWGNYQSGADLDGDISTPVGIHDLLLLLEAWGDCPNPCDQNPCHEDCTPCSEGCTYDVCDSSGPCYDDSACFDLRCAQNSCYSGGCPGYDYCYCDANPWDCNYQCGFGDPCKCWGDCPLEDDCMFDDGCDPFCPGYSPCNEWCWDYDPCACGWDTCDPSCWNYDPCDPSCPDYDPCDPMCCEQGPECPDCP